MFDDTTDVVTDDKIRGRHFELLEQVQVQSTYDKILTVLVPVQTVHYRY
jgi:hypothetical protein